MYFLCLQCIAVLMLPACWQTPVMMKCKPSIPYEGCAEAFTPYVMNQDVHARVSGYKP